ncbi:MAG: HemK2/MTQ2 family protein methyltransferase [Candidatus Aenigmatarchaeota archaeon]
MAVYAPSEDSLFLMKKMEKHIQKHRPKTVLDVGTGSGILAKRARELLPQARVFATDIGKDAIRYAKESASGVRFILSDMLSGVRGRFGLIVFNPPYLPAHIYDKDPTTTGGPLGCETANRFIRQLPEHLAPGGRCLLLISSQTNPGRIEPSLEKGGFGFEVVGSMKLFFETLYVYSIYLRLPSASSHMVWST